MEFIVDFYKNLETLDLIIFWGIIIVIILLIIFSVIMMSKNKKLKKFISKNNDSENTNQYEELPIKEKIQNNQALTKETKLENENIEQNNQESLPSVDLPEIPRIKKEQNDEYTSQSIETEKKFIAEEHVMEYNKDFFSLPNMKRNDGQSDIITESNIKDNSPLTIPSGPYQRNVLREMSLNQTSPIGLTTPKKKEEKKFEMAKDLEESLNSEINDSTEIKNNQNKINSYNNNQTIRKENTNTTNEDSIRESNYHEKNEEIFRNNNQFEMNRETKITPKEEKQEPSNDQYNKTEIKITTKDKQQEMKEIIKKELQRKDYYSERKTEIRNNNENRKEENSQLSKEIKDYYNINKRETKILETPKQEKLNNHNENNSFQEENSNKKNSKPDEYTKNDVDPQTRELLNSVAEPVNIKKNKSSSEKYLEEVSKKLAEAEVPDEIERTDYELEQEENAIISYKELMEKKDSIQTIDEEEAVISIEELMNRSKQKEENIETTTPDGKLYKLTEEEENDDFIKELKQFRNDL